MKSIAFVSTMTGARWGGSEELWSRAAGVLRDRGVAVQVFVPTWRKDADPLTRLGAAGCSVTGYRTFDKLTPLIGGRWQQKLCVATLRKSRPDHVVIAQGYQLEGLAWMRACQALGIEYSILVQSVGEQGWPNDAERPALAEGFEGARHCFVVSRANADMLRRQLAIPLRNETLVWNPVNVPLEAAPAWPPQEVLKLACVGRLHSMSKGQDVLLSALRQDKWRARPLQVSFFGQGPNEHTLRSLKEMWGLENVEFRGQTSNVEEIWREHHALVLTSRYEGLPLVVVEAMLCGRPCIVTDVAGNTEVIEDDVTGFIAAAPSARYVDEAMERAWSRRSEWREMGARAARSIRRLLPPDPVLDFADKLCGAGVEAVEWAAPALAVSREANEAAVAPPLAAVQTESLHEPTDGYTAVPGAASSRTR